MNVGDPVLVWSGPIPVGARVLRYGEAPSARRSPADRILELIGAAVDDHASQCWLDICVLGQHLPQAYRFGEIMPLDVETARRFALCPTCLGFGTTTLGPVALAAGIDEVIEPCSECEGSGRPAMRVTISRSPGSIMGNMEVLEHEPVMLQGNPMCLACGLEAAEPLANHVTVSAKP